MFSYMYEVDLPKLDINSNRMGLSPSREKSIGFSINKREQSARERSKLRRSKSTQHMLQRPRSHRFRREVAREYQGGSREYQGGAREYQGGAMEFSQGEVRQYVFPATEINIIDLEEEENLCSAAAWCVNFEERQRPQSRVREGGMNSDSEDDMSGWFYLLWFFYATPRHDNLKYTQ